MTSAAVKAETLAFRSASKRTARAQPSVRKSEEGNLVCKLASRCYVVISVVIGHLDYDGHATTFAQCWEFLRLGLQRFDLFSAAAIVNDAYMCLRDLASPARPE